MDSFSDALESFEVHEVLPQMTGDECHRNKKEASALVFQYLADTHFLKTLRNNYIYFKEFTSEDVKKLYKTAEVFRAKKANCNMAIHFNQPTVCIIIFGDLTLNEHRFYQGDFFATDQPKLELYFHLKTTMVMLSKEDLENTLYELENYYFKKKQIEKILPVQAMELNKQQLSLLIEHAQSLEGTIVNKSINQAEDMQKGILILYEGTYGLRLQSGIVFTQICFDYFGQQILWSDCYDYDIEALSNPYRFIFLSKTILKESLSDHNLMVLKEIYNERKQMRKRTIKQIADNLEFTKKFFKNMDHVKTSHSNIGYYRQLQGKITRRPVTTLFLLEQRKSIKARKKQTSLHTDNQKKSPKKQEQSEETPISVTTYSNFRSTLYKDQRAQSQKLFRKRSVTGEGKVRKIHSIQKDPKKVQQLKRAKTQASQLDGLPKSIALLLRHYDTLSNKKKGHKQQVSIESKTFLSSSRERRMATNMKIHRQIFLKQYFQVKLQEDRAFKTWR